MANRPGSGKPSSRNAGPSRGSRIAPKKTTSGSKRGAAKETMAPIGGSSGRPKRKKRVTSSAAAKGVKLSRRYGGVVPPELTYKTRGPRLQKVMADSGIASRRDCEQLIARGHVMVNGELVTGTPVFVDPKLDKIEVAGTLIDSGNKNKKTVKSEGNTRIQKVYVLVNKPKNVICTTRDPQERKKVTDLVELPNGFPERIYPVGRLDFESTGAIILTNDGDLTNALTHPSHEVSKRYRVSLRGIISDDEVQKLRDGLYLADQKSSLRRHQKGVTSKKASMLEVKKLGFTKDKTHGDRSSLEITLTEGQNREIRRMLARLGYKVRTLERVAIGPITIKGVPLGGWRLLTGAEVAKLFKVAGIKTTTKLKAAKEAKLTKEQIEKEVKLRDEEHKNEVSE